MEFAMMGISYKKAALAIREQSAFTDTKCLSFYNSLLNYDVDQAVVVSTCNRSEIYFIYENEKQIMDVKQLFLKMTCDEAEPFMDICTKHSAFIHLFEVCGGYHSLVPGEDQIAHQMKKAYELSSESGACGKEMHKIFQSCFASIRELKATYLLNQNAVSVGYISMKKLKQHMDVKNKSILIIGSGEMADLMRTYAIEEGFQHILLCNRTIEHLQTDDRCEIIPFQKRYEAISRCDVVCSATASPHVIIEEPYVQSDHPLFMLDLAVPRDMDECLKGRKHIVLWDMDDLKESVDEHLMKRKKLLKDAHHLLEKDVEELENWLNFHTCDHVIATMKERSEEMALQTYELLNRKLNLSSREQYVLKKVLHSSFLRMVKEPMMQLRKLENEDRDAYVEMLETLFKGEVTS